MQQWGRHPECSRVQQWGRSHCALLWCCKIQSSVRKFVCDRASHYVGLRAQVGTSLKHPTTTRIVGLQCKYEMDGEHLITPMHLGSLDVTHGAGAKWSAQWHDLSLSVGVHRDSSISDATLHFQSGGTSSEHHSSSRSDWILANLCFSLLLWVLKTLK